jgi:hypothetical protein
MFDFAEAKTKARRILRDYLGFDGLYNDDTGITDYPVKVRFHTKIRRFGDLIEAGYPEVIEGVDRLIFDRDKLAEDNMVLRTGGTVKLTHADYQDITLILDSQEPITGSVEVVWNVSKR